MISGYRANNGLGAVTLDPELMQLAEEHSRNMAARDKLDHDVGKRIQPARQGSTPKAAVENVSAGYHTLAEAFSGWRKSPPHRANMLNKGATRMGIAAVYSPKSKYKVFWTLILAPDDKAAEPGSVVGWQRQLHWSLTSAALDAGALAFSEPRLPPACIWSPARPSRQKSPPRAS